MPDMIINATSLGLKKDDQIELDYKKTQNQNSLEKRNYFMMLFTIQVKQIFFQRARN